MAPRPNFSTSLPANISDSLTRRSGKCSGQFLIAEANTNNRGDSDGKKQGGEMSDGLLGRNDNAGDEHGDGDPTYPF